MPEPTPPPPHGLAAGSARLGEWLFRWRSYPPVVVLAYVLWSVARAPAPAGGPAWSGAWVAAGLVLGALGLGVRGWAVGQVPHGTSGRGTRALRADTLNTTGLYSLVRHPLYLGNYFLWVGVPVLPGKPGAAVVVTLAFALYYERIMMAEEHFLHRRFGDAFAAWAARTPAFVPRPGGWVPSPYPFSVRFWLGRDYPALYAFVVSTTAVAVARGAALGRGWYPGRGWALYAGAGTAVYLTLHLLRRTTSVLQVGDR